MSIFAGCAAFCLYLMSYAALGILMPEKWHKGSLLNMILTGFFAYYALFQIVALPLKLLDVPLKIVSVVWLGVLILVFGSVLLFRRKALAVLFRERIAGYRTGVPGIIWILLVAALLSLQGDADV